MRCKVEHPLGGQCYEKDGHPGSHRCMDPYLFGAYWHFYEEKPMPIPKDLTQDKIIVNGQKATDLGRTPNVAKPWRDGDPAKGLIDPVTMRPVEQPGSKAGEEEA